MTTVRISSGEPGAAGGGRSARAASSEDDVLLTPDRRYLVVRGRLWRASNPGLGARRRKALTAELMQARRAVARAKRGNEAAALARARARVQAAKLALGERGPVWWSDGAPDFNRFLAKNTPYREWYARVRGKRE